LHPPAAGASAGTPESRPEALLLLLQRRAACCCWHPRLRLRSGQNGTHVTLIGFESNLPLETTPSACMHMFTTLPGTLHPWISKAGQMEHSHSKKRTKHSQSCAA
jgi:hypothetical protein